MKRFILAGILFFPVLVLGYWFYWGLDHSTKLPSEDVKKTVEQRLEEFGPAARARLRPMFAAKSASYPPARLVLLGLKAEKVLQVYAPGANQRMALINSYPIQAASGVVGPKLREGDEQVPEGIYGIESLNPNSKYHLSLRVNYPNEFDREQARKEGRSNLGGDIMIHGSNVSVGCLAMGDATAEDLFVLAADTGITNVSVILSPIDFRTGATAPDFSKLPSWSRGLYETIKAKLSELPVVERK
jgi:murein L,D-transpeptidase YafK